MAAVQAKAAAVHKDRKKSASYFIRESVLKYTISSQSRGSFLKEGLTKTFLHLSLKNQVDFQREILLKLTHNSPKYLE